MFRTLLDKEMLEQRRTTKLLIFLAVFFIVGCISPLLARYTPELLRTIPDIPPEYANLIPTATLKDSIDQYAKNTSQFGVLLVILLNMNIIAQERERGTAAMLFNKPVRRSTVVVSKWLAGMVTVTLSLLVSGIACALYTVILFGVPSIGRYLVFNLLLLLFLAVYLSVALLASALARTQGMAAAGAFGGLTILLVLSALPRINNFTPAGLLGWGSAIMSGTATTFWPALAISVAIIAACIIISCWYIERQEI
jgi:ABC-2 type transport system permease protein